MNTVSLFDVLILACGCYFVYSGVMMKKTGSLKGGLLIGKNVDLSKAKDLPGYISYMYAKTLIVGVLAVVSALSGLINTYVTEIIVIQAVTSIIFLIAILAYGYFSVKGQKTYLDN